VLSSTTSTAIHTPLTACPVVLLEMLKKHGKTLML
jgi:hypothetical protein